MKFLSLLAFISVAALVSGKPLGRRAQCVNEAAVNSTTQRCECKDGFKGDGDLCCARQNQGLCILRDDPILKTVRHVTAWINFPCTYSITRISNQHGSAPCDMEIFAAGNFIEYAQYNDHLGLKINIGNEQKILKLISQTVYDPLANTVTRLSPARNADTLRFANNEFRMGYDFILKRWTVDGCGSRIIFRAPGNVSVHQDKTPGICVVAPKKYIVGSPKGGNICNINENFKNTPYDSIELKLLSMMLAGHKDIDDVVRVDPDPIQGQCTDISASFSKCRAAEKVDAVKTCGPILTQRVVKHCFNRENVSIVDTFKDCLQAYCDKDGDACRRLKESKAVDKCHFSAALCDRI